MSPTFGTLVQVVPRLPPAVNGLGDYALNLAHQLREEHGIETFFIVADPNWKGKKVIDEFHIDQVSASSENALLRLLYKRAGGQSRILLHYVGYGYAKRGCPFWLVDAMQQWRSTNNKSYVLTMFHETHASGGFWSSAFWLSGLQKKLVVELAGLSDYCFTSRQSSADLICELSGGAQSQIRVLPIFSNVGEPQCLLPLSERCRRLVVFGTLGRRIEVYRRSKDSLRRICSRLGVEEIVDIGRPLDFDIEEVMGMTVRALGEVSAREVSHALQDAIAGVLDYPAELLAKSGIYAAYCAHKLIPVIATYGTASKADGLLPGEHYWVSTSPVEGLDLDVGQAIADKALDWYKTHNLSTHAQVFASHLTSARHST